MHKMQLCHFLSKQNQIGIHLKEEATYHNYMKHNALVIPKILGAKVCTLNLSFFTRLKAYQLLELHIMRLSMLKVCT